MVGSRNTLRLGWPPCAACAARVCKSFVRPPCGRAAAERDGDRGGAGRGAALPRRC